MDAEYSTSVLASLADSHEVVAWHDPGAPPPERPSVAGVERCAFESTNEVHGRLNDGVPIFDLVGAGAAHAWIAVVLSTCPGLVLIRSPRWHDLASHLPDGPADHLRVAHREHGRPGLDAAAAFWRGHLDIAELEEELPLTGWVAGRALAVLVDPAGAAAPDDALHVPTYDLPSEPAAAAERLLDLAHRAPELRQRFAANALADDVGGVVRQWVTSRAAADATFARAAGAIETMLGGPAM